MVVIFSDQAKKRLPMAAAEAPHARKIIGPWLIANTGRQMPIIWNDQYSVDGGAIDEDHRLLFRLFNQVEADAADDPAGVTVGLRELCDACRRHFRRKERLQHAVRYPHAEDYRQRHANMLMRLEDIAERTLPLNDPRAATALLADVRVWLTEHILKHDMTLKPFAGALRRAGEALGRSDLKNV